MHKIIGSLNKTNHVINENVECISILTYEYKKYIWLTFSKEYLLKCMLSKLRLE